MIVEQSIVPVEEDGSPDAQPAATPELRVSGDGLSRGAMTTESSGSLKQSLLSGDFAPESSLMTLLPQIVTPAYNSTYYSGWYETGLHPVEIPFRTHVPVPNHQVAAGVYRMVEAVGYQGTVIYRKSHVLRVVNRRLYESDANPIHYTYSDVSPNCDTPVSTVTGLDCSFYTFATGPVQALATLNAQITSSIGTVIDNGSTSNSFYIYDDVDPATPNLTATVSGPPTLELGQSGTFTAQTAGGSPNYPVQIAWHYQLAGSSTWVPAGSGTTKSITMQQAPYISVRVTVSRGEESVTASTVVHFCAGNTCNG